MRHALVALTIAVPLAVLAAGDTKFLGPACSGNSGSCFQTANDATANEPTSSTPGLTLEKVCGLRVTLLAGLEDGGVSDENQSLSGGSIKFWNKSFGNRWAVNQTAVSQTADAEAVVIYEGAVNGQEGYVYVEADTVDTALADGGTGTVHVGVQTIDCHQSR